MLRKRDQFEGAVALRKRGLSYNEILDVVDIGRGTISRWLRNVPLTSAQQARLVERRRHNGHILNLQKEAHETQIAAKNWASRMLRHFRDSSESLLLCGALLYWCEGSRNGRYREFAFTNTDPFMIALILRFLRCIVLVPESKIRIMVRIPRGSSLEKAERYWRGVTGIPSRQFRNPEYLIRKPDSVSLTRYPYGMCRICVYDVAIFRKVEALINYLAR